jgi:hypothetical protein
MIVPDDEVSVMGTGSEPRDRQNPQINIQGLVLGGFMLVTWFNSNFMKCSSRNYVHRFKLKYCTFDWLVSMIPILSKRNCL